jgi:nitric oxide reductase subunit C
MKFKTLRFPVFIFAFLVVLGAEAIFAAEWSPTPILPSNPLDGSRLFTEKGCLRCHSIYGTGGVMGPDLGQGILNRPLLDIAGVMWNHSPGMEHVFHEQRGNRPKFEAAEMANLLAFLYYLGSLDPVGDPEAGERLFRERRCNVCHALAGKGGKVGPALDKYGHYASPIFLTSALWNRGQAMARVMERMRVPRAVMRGNDISDLMAYIRSANGGLARVYIQPGNPQEGEKLFRKKQCAECHALKGRGKGIGPDLRANLKGSLMQIAGAIWNHGPKMWVKMVELGIAIPTLTDVETADLISYLYFLQFIDEPGDVERGRIVYREKRCVSCHTLPGVTGTAGPDLAEVEKLATPLEVITEMWNHASTMEQRMLEESVQWPILKEGEMADLIAYLLSVRSEASRTIGEKNSKPKGRDSGPASGGR